MTSICGSSSRGVISIELACVQPDFARNAAFVPPANERRRAPRAPQVALAVRDTGSGMDQDLVQRVFEPFFTTKPTGQGTGLGLSLAYDIVKAHGGELEVETREGEGSEFIINLPV